MEDALKLLIDELKFLREERERNRNEQGKKVEDEGEKLKLEGERATTRFLFQLKNLVKLKSYEEDEKRSRGIQVGSSKMSHGKIKEIYFRK